MVGIVTIIVVMAGAAIAVVSRFVKSRKNRRLNIARPEAGKNGFYMYISLCSRVSCGVTTNLLIVNVILCEILSYKHDNIYLFRKHFS